jgi:4-phospho-D-threonate 3-dehydrogenase / 4-phospho-D-erythronate 3-dehydrogenase
MYTKELMDKPVLAILLGDAAGVGPEIVAKVAAKGFLNEYCYPVIIGDVRVLQMAMRIAQVDFPYTLIEEIDEANWEKGIPVLDQKNINPEEIKAGQLSPICGKASGDMLIKAIELYKSNKIDGFCFAPLNKASMKKGGHLFESEQYLFAHYFNWSEPFGEVNVLDNLWTSRVTSHIPIKEVSNHLNVDSIFSAVKLVDKTLRRAGVENPRISIAALNPHAGEDGLCGREEIDVILPAIEESSKNGINLAGPYPADILFIKAFNGDFDAAVTMYHDQGQIALKLKGFDYGITIAAGFPAPIVTAAHGTAYDIAGKGIAKTTAFENAVKMAARIAANDRKGKTVV